MSSTIFLLVGLGEGGWVVRGTWRGHRGIMGRGMGGKGSRWMGNPKDALIFLNS